MGNITLVHKIQNIARIGECYCSILHETTFVNANKES